MPIKTKLNSSEMDITVMNMDIKPSSSHLIDWSLVTAAVLATKVLAIALALAPCS